MILQALLTIIGGALLYVFSKSFELYLIKPYHYFKQEVIETKIDLLFYKNILTNAFERESANERFIEKILTCQEKIRSRWSKLSVKYETVPKWIFSRKLPTYEEMKTIEENLIYLSNRSIIYSKNNIIYNDCSESINKLDKIIEYFEKILKSAKPKP